MEYFNRAKKMLFEANTNRRHPFRTAVLGTSDQQGNPAIRTVVIRNVGPNLNVLIYTDSRSPKVGHISQHPEVSMLWYDRESKLQIRLTGSATMVKQDASIFASHLKALKESGNISDYTTGIPPGSPVQATNAKDKSESIHFGLIKVVPNCFDILELNRTQHRRFKYQKQNGEWREEEITP